MLPLLLLLPTVASAGGAQDGDDPPEPMVADFRSSCATPVEFHHLQGARFRVVTTRGRLRTSTSSSTVEANR